MKDTTIYLVRHGQSEGNEENRMRGRHDFSLTDKGIKQAESIAEKASEWNISAIFTSPLKRAKDTAEIIGKRCGIEPVIDRGFQNISLGDWEGKTRDWVAYNYPEEWKVWNSNPERLKFAGSEPLSEIQERSYKALRKRTDELRGDNFCIVTHRAVLKPLIAKILDMNPPYYWKLKMGTSSYSRIIYNGKIYYIDLFNQTEHLKKE